MFFEAKKTIQSFFIPRSQKEKFRLRIALNKLLKKYKNSSRYHEQRIQFATCDLVVPDALSVVYQLREIFIDENLKFESASMQPVIYDCGANVGTVTLYFKKLFPESTIKAFEADKKIINYLEQNLSRNRCLNNVQIIPKAVWINEGMVDFGSEGADSGSLFFTTNRSKIESTRLRDWLANEARVDFLKLDIEGAESAVIQDCDETLSRVKYLFIEYHSFPNTAQELDKILHTLTKNNFRYAVNTVYSPGNTFNTKISQYRSMDLILNIYATNTQFN